MNIKNHIFKNFSSKKHISEKKGFLQPERLKELILEHGRKKLDTIYLGFVNPYSSLSTIEVNPDLYLKKFEEKGVYISSNNFFTDIEGKYFYGDKNNKINKQFLLKPDLSTIRNMGWSKNNSVLIFCDVYDTETNELSEVSPRSILKKKLNEFTNQGLTLNCASELEYYLYQKPYSDNVKKGLKSLKEVGSVNEDYLIQQGDLLEFVNEPYRTKLKDSGIEIETTKGEAAIGQHEINMKYSQAMEQSDNALVLKAAMKSISDQNKTTITFMAKPEIHKSGSSCHLHLSVFDKVTGKNIFVGDEYKLTNTLTCSNNLLYFLGGIMKYSLDTFIMFAPTINSYKRYKSFSWAPTNLDSWSYDNRTSPFRICGSGNNLRVEYRPPGGDANQYLSYSAVIAAGIKGLKEKIQPPEVFKGSSYENKNFKKPPIDLAEALDYFKNSEFIKDSFSKKEYDFICSFYENEVEEYERNVTEWEQKRYFYMI